jgi:hypothetical protein
VANRRRPFSAKQGRRLLRRRPQARHTELTGGPAARKNGQFGSDEDHAERLLFHSDLSYYFVGREERQSRQVAPAAVVKQKALPERGWLRPVAPVSPGTRQTRALLRFRVSCFAYTKSSVGPRSQQAEQRLGLPVNPVLCSLARWFAAADPLIQQIRTAPLVWVAGEEPREGEG